ncbi:MAG TPA: NAD(P)/FAD-dependent oxidoreductase [Chitinophagaceae bacterium]|nr:NAD(P)/FAD-dependent oxidoreductase [Chitinophagaceae bacterium]
MHETDVCIIGAGPAGTVASMFLSKNGIKHVVLERAQFPRDKVCGEFYDGRVRNVLNKLDETLMPRMQERHIIQDIHHYYIYNAKLNEIGFDATSNARISTVRSRFDDYLLAETLKSPYVTYFDNTQVEDINISSEAVHITARNRKKEITAKMVIAATGSKSALAQKLVPHNKHGDHFLLAARGYYTGLPHNGKTNCCRLVLLKMPVPCYLGTVDLPGGLSLVEVFVLKRHATSYNINPKVLLQQIIHEHKPLSKLFEHAVLYGSLRGASLPLTTGKGVISGERVLLAGDSAYNINPLTGLGVGRAVYSGMCAAEQCIKALQAGDFSAAALREYDERVYRVFKADNRTGIFGDFVLKDIYKLPHRLISLVSSSPYLKRQATNILNKF